MEQKKDTNLPFRAEAADRDADLQKFADFLSELGKQCLPNLKICRRSEPEENFFELIALFEADADR